MSATRDLLDVNVWLALAFAGHPQNKNAIRAWGELASPGFCRVTQLGLLRLLCNSNVMGANVMTPEAAWAAWEKMHSLSSVEFLDEPPGLDGWLKKLTHGSKASRDFWTDTYLAAFAQCAGLRLVSFDAGFSRYKNLQYLRLDSSQSS